MKNKLISLLLGILLVCSLTPFAFANTEERQNIKITLNFIDIRKPDGSVKDAITSNTISPNGSWGFTKKKFESTTGLREGDTGKYNGREYIYNGKWTCSYNPSEEIDATKTFYLYNKDGTNTGNTYYLNKDTTLTFKPVWTPVKQYTLTAYYTDKIAHGTGKENHIDDGKTGYNHTFKIPADIPSEYKFMYWKDYDNNPLICWYHNNTYDNNKITYTAEEAVGVKPDSLDKDSSITLIATYKPIPTIEYYDQNNDYIGSATSEEVDIYDAGAQYVPEVNGTFEGWYDKNGNKIDENTIKSYDLRTEPIETVTKVYAHFSYTVTWVDEDGTILETDEKLEYGTTPSYDSDTPTKDSDLTYDYIFASWTPEIVDVTEDTTYTATYDQTLIPIEPEPTIDPKPEPDPDNEPKSDDNPNKPEKKEQKRVINNQKVTPAFPTFGGWIPTNESADDEEIEPEDIDEDRTPKGFNHTKKYWALINLICVILSAIFTLISLFIKRKKYEDEDLQKKEKRKKIILKIIGIILFICGIVLFILTEDMTATMILIDKWTLLNVLLFINNLLAFFILIDSKKENGEEDEEEKDEEE